MPFQFTCPNCGAETLVDDRYAGTSGPCATCGQPMTVAPLPERPRLREAPQTPGSDVRSVRAMLALLLASGVLLSVVAALFVSVVQPQMSRSRQRMQQTNCANRLGQIGLALRSYHDAYGCYPPAFIADAGGRPVHSWRVLILPFLGEQRLYHRYDFREPWNGPNNAVLATAMPAVYADPADPASSRAGETSFLAVTGDGTVFPRGRVTRVGEIRDGPQDTVAIAESTTARVLWLEPSDLPVTRLSFALTGTVNDRISSAHEGGPHVLTADGTVRQLRLDVPPAQLRGLMTIDGGESVRWKSLTP